MIDLTIKNNITRRVYLWILIISYYFIPAFVAELYTEAIAGYYGTNLLTPGPANDRKLYNPFGIWGNSLGELYIADQFNYRVAIYSGGNLSSLVADYETYVADDDYAETLFSAPRGIIGDTLGNIYFSDGRSIWKYSTESARLTVYAGNGLLGSGWLREKKGQMQAFDLHQVYG
jgi:hypothetical protein